MKCSEYHRHKLLIELAYRNKIRALKEMYPEEWAKDHKRKAAADEK